MHLDPILPLVVGVALAAIILALIVRAVRQPYVIGYLFAGVLLGPHGLALVGADVDAERLGAIGVVILLFFVGMEVSLSQLVDRWRVALIGTALQIAASVGFAAILGWFGDWSLNRILLLGFVISLSSTAVVIKLLQDWSEFDTPVGRDVLAVLLAQDLAIVPMLLLLQASGGAPLAPALLAAQIAGGAALLAGLWWLFSRSEVHLPLGPLLRRDHELQVFTALILCFGLALLTGLLGLSSALGAFVAGVIVARARETHWVSERLESFRVVFVALFFFSIGMLIDLAFVRANAGVLAVLVAGVLATNTLINAGIFRLLGRNWRVSFYGGALLSQIGEFSFVLAAVGKQAGIVTDFAYQTTVAMIALTLIASPPWIAFTRWFARPGPAPA